MVDIVQLSICRIFEINYHCLSYCFYLQDCWEQDTVYRADPVRGIKNFHLEDVFSPADCQKACQDDGDCNYWVWNSPDFAKKPNTCWLKAGKGTVKAKAGKISGPKYGCTITDDVYEKGNILPYT